MSLQFIIDGYNLTRHRLFSHAQKKNSNPHRALAAFIRSKNLTGSRKNKVTVVFDGYPQCLQHQEKDDDIQIVFAKEVSADEKIKKLLENSSQPKNIVVVSDDKEIRFFVRSYGARSLRIEEFIKDRSAQDAQRASREQLKQELTYSQMYAINQELKKLWLRP